MNNKQDNNITELKMMFKKISLIASMLFFLLGTTVFAHSHLESSSPKNGEVLTQPLKEIALTFETTLESTSTFTLEDSKGTSIPLSKVSIEGNKLIGTLNNELANGGYKIHWKIIGTDGHPLEGDISFSVQLPAKQTTSAAASASSEMKPADKNKTEEAAAPKKVENTALLTKNTETMEPSFKDYVVPGSVALLIIFVISGYWLFYRRKHA
ncbi:copper resistance CopC family protein [Neobacillus drentensis]|uniref:copper resistance CopC family protein n=1 Tax=Neobacillus drentensis TaxID=220684 RepID=UPI0030035C18